MPAAPQEYGIDSAGVADGGTTVPGGGPPVFPRGAMPAPPDPDKRLPGTEGMIV